MIYEIIFPVFAKIDWNGGPELFNIGKLSIRWYSLMWLLAFLAGLWIMRKVYKAEKLNLEEIDTMFVWVFLGVILGARFGEAFYSWDEFKHAPWQIIIPVDDNWKFIGYRGLASHGAAAGLITVLYFLHKKFNHTFLWLLDRVALASGIGAAAIRVGNFFNHEIVGKAVNPDSLPWAVKFMQNGYYDEKLNKFGDDINEIYRHPAQLYEAFFYLLVFGIMFFIWKKFKEKTPNGLLGGLFLTLVFGFRFLVEFLKETQTSADASRLESLGINTGQMLSIPLFLVGLGLIIYSIKKGKLA